ncbi:hypothetical protein [Thiolapillus sp.]|uniref:hypothetical protein n=1 Tax=Thiolapillus sp. TaxID=2017437 RepID=UPI003AF50117
MKYYIVEKHYIGPNADDTAHIDFDRFEVTTKPPRHESKGLVLQGWLGTYDNMYLYAHGAYDSLAAAEHYIQTRILNGEFRQDPDDDLPPDVLAVYRPGRLPPITDGALIQWLEYRIEVSADDDDEELERQADTMIYELQQEGRGAYRLQMRDALEFLRDSARTTSRDELKNLATCTALEDSILDAVDVLNVLRIYARKINK